MFYEVAVFNKPLSGWDVSSVVNMGYMFDGASDFYQNLSAWQVDSVALTEVLFGPGSKMCDSPANDDYWPPLVASRGERAACN